MRKISTLEELDRILRERVKDLPLSKIPHYSKLNGVNEASRMIKKAIRNNEFITVIGDYDVDGIVSSVIMKKFFDRIGYKNYEIIIPDRFKEGYGISPLILERVNPETSLIITVDNGITGYEAFDILSKTSVKTILTDHHMPKTDEKGNMIIPKADIIINPKVAFDYELKDICGAEVAWYLLAGLKNEAGFNIDLGEFLDYLALAIIADVMPLIDMNRALVIAGLNRIKKGKKPFSRILIENFKNIDSNVIAYQIAPRINAAGRLGMAGLAFNFLSAGTYEEAYRMYCGLTSLNEERKKIQEDIQEEIKPIVYDRFVFAIGEYHSGVTGIIASKLVEKYKKPCIVFNRDETGILKGSGRSLGNIDLFRLINPLKDLYVTFGGHPGACGISIEEKDFENFAQKIDERSKILFKEEDYFIEENILGEIDFKLVKKEGFLEILEKYEPYGNNGNPVPVFVTKKVKPVKTEIIKNKFIKGIFEQSGYYLEGIMFDLVDLNKSGKYQLKYSVKRNYFSNPNLIIKDIF